MFKVGGKVRCLTPVGELESGSIYTVRAITQTHDTDYHLYVDRMDIAYAAFRFELVNDPGSKEITYSYPGKTPEEMIRGSMTAQGGINFKKINTDYNTCTITAPTATLFDAHKVTAKNDKKSLTLPTDSAERKNYPMLSGCLNYFPAALAGVAHISKIGNDKHNPGQPLHHARGKSTDHGDCIIRHLTDTEDLLASLERDGNITQEMILTEANCLAWRALAYTQELHEKFGAPLAPGAKDINPPSPGVSEV